jgi:D-alanyl-D-alanine carboxypeptidase (penicillin-binding protein 5/6)
MRKFAVVFICLVVLIGGAALYQIHRPVPPVTIAALAPAADRVPGTLSLSWPAEGSASVAVAGIGLMGEVNGTQVYPLASVAKLMTAYLTLQKHPLGPYADGPSVTITAQDVADYRADVAARNSVAKVALGETFTERQLLEALLLPSGDNIATLLARWNSGSVSAFVQEMNSTAKTLGMTHTHYADPAGVDPSSAGSALDQVTMAEADMANPAFRAIVAMPQARLPTGAVVYNTDYVLGKGGIIGIKTGSMSAVGANFVFATQPLVDGKPVLLIGCVMGQHGPRPLMTALTAGQSLARQAAANLTQVALVKSGARIATLSSAWGQSAAVSAGGGMDAVVWPGLPITRRIDAAPLGVEVAPNAVVGHLVVAAGGQTASLPLTAGGAIAAPTLSWTLLRGL